MLLSRCCRGIAMFRRRLLSAATFVPLMVGTAFAEPPASNWSGFYLGGNVGGGWGSAQSDYSVSFTLLLDPSTSSSQSMSGVIGGVQAGYNWQIANWVWGLETDFQGSSLTSGTSVSIDPAVLLPTVTDVHTIKLPWFGTVRGRFGFTPATNWLVYGTGGLAYGGIDESNTLSPLFVVGSHDFVQAGWTIGGGVAAALNRNWSVRLEYLYLDFGRFTDTAAAAGGFVTGTIDSRLSVNVVRVGLDYAFAPLLPPPPIVTKN